MLRFVSITKLNHVSATARWGSRTLWQLDKYLDAQVVGERLHLADAHVGEVVARPQHGVVAQAGRAGDAAKLPAPGFQFSRDSSEKADLGKSRVARF